MARIKVSALDPLEGLASLGLAGLLPFHHSCIAGEQACWPQEGPQLRVIALQCLADAMPDSLRQETHSTTFSDTCQIHNLWATHRGLTLAALQFSMLIGDSKDA